MSAGDVGTVAIDVLRNMQQMQATQLQIMMAMAQNRTTVYSIA